MNSPESNELEALMRAHGPFLVRLARALTADSAAAEDLLGDTWVAALRPGLGPLRSERGWLATVMRRRAAALRGKDRRLAQYQQDSQLGREAAPDEILAQIEREQMVNDALAQLEEPYRSVLFLRYHEGLKPAAIAKRTGAPLKTVKTRLSRGLEYLRRALDQQMASRGASDPRAEWFSALLPLAILSKTAPVTSLAGALAMKKIVVVAVAALVLVAAGIWATGGRGAYSPSVAQAPLKRTDLASVGDTGTAAPDEPAEVASVMESSHRAPLIAPDSLASLEVRLVDPEDRPVPGATVLLRRVTQDGRPEPIQALEVDHEGRTTFTDLVPGSFRVGDTLLRQRRRVELKAGERGTLTLKRAEEITVRGIVRRADGTPASGARIDGGRSTPLSVFAIGTSDIQGRFEVRCSLHNYGIQASVAGQAASPRILVDDMALLEDGSRAVELTLGEPGSRLTGRVMSSDGAPVAEAQIIAGPRTSVWTRSAGYSPLPVTVFTDERGKFTYPQALPTGEHEVIAFAAGFAKTILPHQFESKPVHLEIVLLRGATLQGRVLTAEGEPADRATVGIDAGDPMRRLDTAGPVHEFVTDQDGVFVLHGVPIGSVTLRAIGRRDAPFARLLTTINDLEDGETREVQLQLSEAPLIAGQVIDEQGLPIAGATITASSNAGGRSPGTHRTDASGAFRVTAITDHPLYSMPFEVNADYFDGTSIQSLGRVEGIALGSTDVLIVAERPKEPGSYVLGRVLTDGPAEEWSAQRAGLKVTIWASDNARGHFIDFDPTSGDYRHGPLPAGDYVVRASVNGQRLAATGSFTIQDGETVTAPDLILPGTGSVRVNLGLTGAETGTELPPDVLASLNRTYLQLENEAGDTRDLQRSDNAWTADDVPEGSWKVRFVESRDFCMTDTGVAVLIGQVTEVAVGLVRARNIKVAAELPDDGSWDEALLTYEHTGGTEIQATERMAPDDLDKPPYAVFRITVPPGPGRFRIQAGPDVDLKADLEVPVISPGPGEYFLIQ